MGDPAKPNPLAIVSNTEPKQRKQRVGVELPDYLPARMLNEFVYCPRLFFYEWVEGIFAHSADTIEGELRHEKLETKSDPLPPPDQESQIHSRSVSLPVDYKKGSPREGEEGPEAWPADRTQLRASPDSSGQRLQMRRGDCLLPCNPAAGARHHR